MTNELQLFDFNGSQVRTMLIDDEPYFIGNDVARVLGYSRLGDALKQHVDNEDSKTLTYKAFGDLGRGLWSGNDFSNKTVINESGMYSLIMNSAMPQAKTFKRWVTHEVLPAIRKTGSYGVAKQMPQSFSEALQLAADQAKRLEAQTKKLEVQQPKVVFADSVATSHTTILVGDLAKILRGNGVNIGQNRLFGWLRDNGYLIGRKGISYNMPTQKAMDLELFVIKETSIVHSNGTISVNKTVKVTGKGQQYLINKFL